MTPGWRVPVGPEDAGVPRHIDDATTDNGKTSSFIGTCEIVRWLRGRSALSLRFASCSSTFHFGLTEKPRRL
jgi:hypothetical protein